MTKHDKTVQVLRIAKFERFGQLDKFEKIWIDLEKFEKIEMIRNRKHLATLGHNLLSVLLNISFLK